MVLELGMDGVILVGVRRELLIERLFGIDCVLLDGNWSGWWELGVWGFMIL